MISDYHSKSKNLLSFKFKISCYYFYFAKPLSPGGFLGDIDTDVFDFRYR